MPLIRGTWFFEQGGYGWTETLWYNGASLDPVLISPVMDRYAQKRIGLCGEETFIKYYRFSAEGVFRDAWVYAYPGLGLRGVIGQDSDTPQVALLCRMRSALGANTRHTYLRGIWDGMIIDGGTYTPTPAFTSRVDTWRTQILNDGWGWLGATTRTQGNVATVTQTAGGTVAVTLSSNVFPGPFPQDATVRIAQVQGAIQINGTQIVRATSATAFETRRRIAIFPYTTGGRVTYNLKSQIVIGAVNIIRVVERKCGRPSYLSRGRRSARAAS